MFLLSLPPYFYSSFFLPSFILVLTHSLTHSLSSVHDPSSQYLFIRLSIPSLPPSFLLPLHLFSSSFYPSFPPSFTHSIIYVFIQFSFPSILPPNIYLFPYSFPPSFSQSFQSIDFSPWSQYIFSQISLRHRSAPVDATSPPTEGYPMGDSISHHVTRRYNASCVRASQHCTFYQARGSIRWRRFISGRPGRS